MAGKDPEQTSRPDGYLLVVEDSHVQAEIIAMLLEEHGYQVKKAANGRIALATVREELPILVVSDILMPEMDGFELTRQIRNDPALAPVPVLLLTGLTDADDVLQALSCGADSLVTKPYNDEFLLRKISQLLTKKKPDELIQKPSVPFPFIYDGKEYTIAESRQKIIEFLLTTYELTMERNRALNHAQNELRDLNTRLEEREVERARLAVIEEYSEDAIIGKTLDGSITRWNAGAERIYGYSSLEMVGKNISLLVPPNHLDDTTIILDRIKNGEKVIRYETLRRKKDGGLLNISLTASPIRDSQNHMIGVSTIAHDVTWRKLTEETLRVSEIRYRRLFETAQDGILIVDADSGQIVEANPYLIDMLGFSHEQFLGKKLWEIGLFKDIVANKDNFEELQRKEYIRYEDMPLETADGRKIAVEFISNVYTVNNKKVIQCNIRDNTERKLAEEAKIASEIRYRRLFEAAQDGILIVDADSGQIVEVNPFLIDMLGFSREQFLGKKLWEIGLFKDIVANKDNFEELQRKKYIRYEDMPLETADGRNIAVEFISNVYTVNNKKVIQCNIRDSTQRKLAEEALRQKNEEMDGYFTNTLDLLGIADTDGHFRRLNKEWESSLGYSPAELEGKWFLDFVHPDDMEASRGALAGLKEGKKVPQFTNRYRHRDGSYRWIEWRLFPAGNLIYASARDVTERKKMADLVEASLGEKEMLLKEIHHRVKNNMQIISSLLLLQSQSVKDEETKLLFRDSMSRIKSIALVHEQLYRSDNLSQIEYGEYLRKMFGPLFESYKSDTRRIAMVIDSDKVMVTIEKAVPCSLIVNEMMSNSLKHAFPGERKGEIRIRFTLDEANGNYILDYSDNGIGLPEGFVAGKSGSLGTSLINGLTRQLKGTLAMVPGPGVHYVITFPSRELRGK